MSATMPRRAQPQIGQRVTVVDLDAIRSATVDAVHEGGRRLSVLTEDGEQLEFVLRGATATFTTSPASAWPQLRFD